MDLKRAVVFVIDPVADFIEKGSAFEMTYGHEDIHPLQELLYKLDNVIRSDVERHFLWVLVTSIYQPNQVRTHNCVEFWYLLFILDKFSHPGLKLLCTTEDGQQSLLDETLFDFHVIKVLLQ